VRSAPAAARHAMLQLQGQAGNCAVSLLVAPGVQRQRKTAGWTGADTSGEGWNVGAKENVEGSGVRRIPVDDVPVGNTLDFSDKVYTDKKGNKISGRANEQAKTTESGARRAIVLKPGGLNVNMPIDVLLHLHGYTSRAWDPYAGWRQSRKATTKGTNKDYHAVRDVDQDRIAQQIGAAGNPQVLGILPQGVGHSQFGNLVPRTYVDAVLDRLEGINELKKPVSGQRQINLVLSGHSGAGHTISAALRAEVAAAKAAAKGKPTGKTPVLAPVEVVLFESINGAGELRAVTDWVDHHLNRVRAALLAARTPADRTAAITSCPILRAYRSRDMYVSMYNQLDDHIKNWFADADNSRVLGADIQRIRDRFKVEVLTGLTTGAGHEKVVGGLGKAEEGPLADALMARRDPSASKLVRGGPAPTATPSAPKRKRKKATKKPVAPGGASSIPVPKPKPKPKSAAIASPPAQAGSATAVASTEPVITFGSRARRDVVAASSLATVGEVLRAARLTKATITSTARTPTDQARAMYQNLAGKNTDEKVERQYRLYGAGGDKVIDTFVELRDRGLSAAAIQEGMRQRIEEVGPRKISKHLADPATLNVLDISPASLGGGDAVARFEKAANALVGSKLDRLLTPGQGDPAEHVELKPVGGGSAPAGAGPAPASADIPATTKPAKSETKTKAPTAAPPRPAPATGPAAPTAAAATADARRPPASAPAAGATTAAPASAPGFITDITRSTLELLPRDQQDRFSKIAWNDQDYPDAKHKIQDTSEENLNRWRNDGGYIVWKVEGKKGKPDTWWMKGAHQAEAQALLDALARVRPGGGERRANTGKHAILTKAQFKEDPDTFDEYIVGQLVDPEGVTKRGDYTMMNKHAAEKFVEMRTAAAADGVTLSINNAFRPRKVAEANAKKKGNPKAVADYSPHSLGLAVDLNLSTRRLKVIETTTAMTNTVKGLSTPAYKWMFMKGSEYGFYQYRMEPWHWEYNPSGFADTFWADDPSLAPSAKAAPAKPAKR
jgi:D-alanyl-D-alanine carboxypeptidase